MHRGNGVRRRVRSRLLKNFRVGIGAWSGESGFSLVEIVIIMLVLGIALVPLTRVSITNLTNGGRFAMETKALVYAQGVVETIIADYMAMDEGRGYDWVIANWSGASTPNPPTGLVGSVAISAEDSLNQVPYVVVQTTVAADDIPNVVLSTWLVKND